jgi:hypothetical protein
MTIFLRAADDFEHRSRKRSLSSCTAGPLLPSFTTAYVADPNHPVATATSDLYAVGITVRDVIRVR